MRLYGYFPDAGTTPRFFPGPFLNPSPASIPPPVSATSPSVSAACRPAWLHRKPVPPRTRLLPLPASRLQQSKHLLRNQYSHAARLNNFSAETPAHPPNLRRTKIPGVVSRSPTRSLRACVPPSLLPLFSSAPE